MTICIENSLMAIFLPALPIRCRSCLFEMSLINASASALEFFTGTKNPFSQSRTVSLQPETFVVTMGRPQDKASIRTLGKPSA